MYIWDNTYLTFSFQACRNGLVTHLEHLLFYSADMNGRNASGNTPLHVCAVNNQVRTSIYFKFKFILNFSMKTWPIQLVNNTLYFQESCVRTLLFRGADKEALNYAGQTAYQVAVIAGNLELAEVIKNHRSEDIGKICISL